MTSSQRTVEIPRPQEKNTTQSDFARGTEPGWDGSRERKDKGGGARTILLNDLF